MQDINSCNLRPPSFTYRAFGSFPNVKEKIQQVKERGNSRYIYQNQQDKACFQHDMSYGDSRGFPSRTASNKVLRDHAFNIAKNPKYSGYQRGLASMVYKFFHKNLW